jgi:hypothetical protein
VLILTILNPYNLRAACPRRYPVGVVPIRRRKRSPAWLADRRPTARGAQGPYFSLSVALIA